MLTKHVLGDGFCVIIPKERAVVIGDFVIWREKDHKRNTYAMFTDHYPISVIFCADELSLASHFIVE